MDSWEYSVKRHREDMVRQRLSKIQKDELIYAIILYEQYKQEIEEPGQCAVSFMGFLDKEYAVYKKRHEDEFYKQVYGKAE